MSRSNLVIDRWKVGFEKVAFTKLIQKEAGLSLSDAKNKTDQIMEGKPIVITLTPENMDCLASSTEALGAIVHRQILQGEETCQ